MNKARNIPALNKQVQYVLDQRIMYLEYFFYENILLIHNRIL